MSIKFIFLGCVLGFMHLYIRQPHPWWQIFCHDRMSSYFLKIYSPWLTHVSLLFIEQLNNVGYQYLSQNNGALPSFNGMRLAPPEPSGYIAMPSSNNPLHFPVPQQSMMYGYAPPQVISGMGLQLGWGLTSPPTKMMMPPAPCQFTCVCVWCSREFRHDGSLAEQQSDTVGSICPSCKDRFAGHGRLG